MHADLMLLYLLYICPLDHDFHKEVKLGKILFYSIFQICCQSHCHLLVGVILV